MVKTPVRLHEVLLCPLYANDYAKIFTPSLSVNTTGVRTGLINDRGREGVKTRLLRSPAVSWAY